ncbi:MAG TPA: 3-hydroxyacyl-CoA dehydrogenase NAD-binding domain-containing protein [Chloroflexota bacterium]|jgi:3-hydroxybutyryl-CoA dehydrogenase|nr:3-hydroxyacyl-CoA dehydrogenase NAD-binding domain-containing protein [Chloroflexota bacterium]
MTEAAQVIRRATVVGAGTMGSGIAQVLATSGLQVTLVDVDVVQLERAQGIIARSLERLERRGTLSAAQREQALGLLRCTPVLDASAGADLMIEAVVEDLHAKRDVFQQAARVLPESALLASNTSSISITALAGAVSHPERVAGMHFFNPVPVMTLVEVVRGHHTSPGTLDSIVALARQLGKSPVVVNDHPGFVSNRILLPMLNEAMFALMEGVAEAEAIDQVMKLGMNHPMGPLELADFIGLDVCLHILEVLHRDLGEDKYRPCPLLRRLVAAGRLGRKSGAGFYDYERRRP